MFLKKNILFSNIIYSLFLVCFQRSKMLWMHQIKIYINYFNFKGKKTTQNSHEKDECVEL